MFPRFFPTTLVLAVLVALSAARCGSDEPLDWPGPEGLYGGWKTYDEATDEVRVFVFEGTNDAYGDLVGLSPVYRLYLFHPNQAALVVQRGSYDIQDRHLVTTVTWSSWDGMGRVGNTYTNEIYEWYGDGFMMESRTAASNQREYERIDPTPYQ